MTAMAKNTDIQSAEKELAGLKLERLDIEATLKKQEAVCYKKFAVNDCLNTVKGQAQAALNSINRREIDINDSQRRLKAELILNKQESKLKKNDVKIDSESSVEKDTRKPKTGTPASNRKIKTDLEVRLEKNRIEKSRADAAKKRVEESNQKLAASQIKAQSRANKNHQSSANTAAYNQKLIKADTHKADLEKNNLERKKAKSASLPIPDSIPTIKVP